MLAEQGFKALFAPTVMYYRLLSCAGFSKIFRSAQNVRKSRARHMRSAATGLSPEVMEWSS